MRNSAFLLLYMVLGSPVLYQVLIATHMGFDSFGGFPCKMNRINGFLQTLGLLELSGYLERLPWVSIRLAGTEQGFPGFLQKMAC